MIFLTLKMMSKINEAHNEKIKDLLNLYKVRKESKAKTIDQKLSNLTFYNRTSKLFQPITNKIAEATKS